MAAVPPGASSPAATLLAVADGLAPLAARFAEAGHELALVGGPVRDIMLGRSGVMNDLDLTTDARPEEIEAISLRHGFRLLPPDHPVYSEGPSIIFSSRTQKPSEQKVIDLPYSDSETSSDSTPGSES